MLKNKGGWLLVLFILCGMVLGSLIATVTADIEYLSWLAYGEEFGLQTPINLDLGMINLTFGLMFSINIASILGLVLAILIYRKI